MLALANSTAIDPTTLGLSIASMIFGLILFGIGAFTGLTRLGGKAPKDFLTDNRAYYPPPSGMPMLITAFGLIFGVIFFGIGLLGFLLPTVVAPLWNMVFPK